MAFNDLDKYTTDNVNNARSNLRRQYRNPTTILDLFSRPLADFDFFSPDKVFQTGDSFRVDIRETGTGYAVTADLPGVKKEDIKLTVENDVLTIRAAHHSVTEQNEEGFLMRERTAGTYERAFRLENVDENAVEAAFENGVLTVTLPRRNAASGKTIAIK